jgi:hypothetical protein
MHVYFLVGGTIVDPSNTNTTFRMKADEANINYVTADRSES